MFDLARHSAHVLQFPVVEEIRVPFQKLQTAYSKLLNNPCFFEPTLMAAVRKRIFLERTIYTELVQIESRKIHKQLLESCGCDVDRLIRLLTPWVELSELPELELVHVLINPLLDVDTLLLNPTNFVFF